MEYVEGVDGNLIIKACRKAHAGYPLPAAMEVSAAVASALDAAYHFRPEGEDTLRVVHRDIKPSNIRLTQDGDVKVLDFGIAQAEFEGREVITDSVRYGSIRYMSPERRSTARDTAAGDVYALGCVLYEFLVGRPFGNAEMTAIEHREKVIGAMRTVRRRAGTDAEAIVALLEQMLAFKPAERPTSEEVSEECRYLSRSLPGEDQIAFAKRFVPQVYSYVADESVAVDRTVGTSPGVSVNVVPRGRTRPLLREETLVPPPPRQGGPRPKPRPILPVRRVTLPVTAAAVVVAISFALQLTRSATASGTALIANQRVHAAALAHYQPLPSAPPTSPMADVAAEPDASEEPPTPPPAPEPAGEEAKAPEEPTTPPPVPPSGTAAEVVETPAEEPIDLTLIPLLRAVKFTLAGAESMVADCLGARAVGTTSVLVREPHVGPCTVRATIDGVDYETEVRVEEAAGLTCIVEGEALTCR
jgi:serine/threonine-protein kinase